MLLTATATDRVVADILQTLAMREPYVWKASFNRLALTYEVRPKTSIEKTMQEVVSFVGERRAARVTFLGGRRVSSSSFERRRSPHHRETRPYSGTARRAVSSTA